MSCKTDQPFSFCVSTNVGFEDIGETSSSASSYYRYKYFMRRTFTTRRGISANLNGILNSITVPPTCFFSVEVRGSAVVRTAHGR